MGDHRTIILPAVLMAALGACSGKKAPPPSPRQAVARLVSVAGTVSHREAASLVWDSARTGMDLYHRDAVRTARSAAARVEFLGGGQLDIEEQSLVVIEAPTRPSGPVAPGGAPGHIAQVEQGTVRGVARPGAPPLRLLTPDGRIASIVATGSRPAPFRARIRPGGKLEVAVFEGEARLELGRESVRLSSRQVVEITRQRVSAPAALPPFPTLVAPGVDARFDASSQVLLRWKPVPGAVLYHVQVSGSVSFEPRLSDETVTGTELGLTALQPGQTYVWRASSINAAGHEGEFGFARRFHVISAPPPPDDLLLAPPNNAGIQYASSPRPITFSWKSDARTFELIVSRRPDLGGKAVRRQRVEGNSVVVRDLTEGRYFWGVTAIRPAGRRPISQKAWRLVISRRLPPGVKVPETIEWK